MAGWHLVLRKQSDAVSEAWLGCCPLPASARATSHPSPLCYTPWNNRCLPWRAVQGCLKPQTSTFWGSRCSSGNSWMRRSPGSGASGSTSISCRLTRVWGRTGDIHRLASLSAKFFGVFFFTLFSTIFTTSPKIVLSFCLHHQLGSRLMQELWAGLRLQSTLLCAWPSHRHCKEAVGVGWRRGFKKPSFTTDYDPGESQLFLRPHSEFASCCQASVMLETGVQMSMDQAIICIK